jgi:polyribonucleotide nucleotidyltransferase
MMVEAGGTEKSWSYYEDGAPKVTEDVLAQGLESAKTWIRESIELQRELVRLAGAKPTISYELFTDYADEVFERVTAVGADAIGKANSFTEKAERNAALDEATTQIIEQLARSSPSVSARSRRRRGRSPRRSCASASWKKECASTAGAPPRSAPCQPPWACCPGCTARDCSNGVTRRS